MYRSQDMWDEAHRVGSVTLYRGGGRGGGGTGRRQSICIGHKICGMRLTG